jgi:hypothetical protein
LQSIVGSRNWRLPILKAHLGDRKIRLAEDVGESRDRC